MAHEAVLHSLSFPFLGVSMQPFIILLDFFFRQPTIKRAIEGAICLSQQFIFILPSVDVKSHPLRKGLLVIIVDMRIVFRKLL